MIGRDLTIQLQAMAAQWAEVWRCEPDGAGIVTRDALLWPVLRHGVPAMLKVFNPEGDEMGAADVLSALDGQGAARLLESGGNALLMERIVAHGPDLRSMALSGSDDEATGILCALAVNAHAALRGADLPRLIPLDRRMGAMGAAASSQPGGQGPLMIWAQDLAAEMLADRSDWRALHGDLHHFNALNDGVRGWLLIDPKGVSGPPVYDLANCILNPYPHQAYVTDPIRTTRQADIVADRLGHARAEVLRWACLHGCLAAAWDNEDGYWAAAARVAGRLSGLRPPQ